jgi:hypothetical protein
MSASAHVSDGAAEQVDRAVGQSGPLNNPFSGDKTGETSKQTSIRPMCYWELYVRVHTTKGMFGN